MARIIKETLLLIAAMVLGAGLIGGLFVSYYLTDNRHADDTSLAEFGFAELDVVTGKGRKFDQAIFIDSGDDSGTAIVSSAAVRLAAETFNELEWQFGELSEPFEVKLLWATRREPNDLKTFDLAVDSSGQGSARLDDIPGWEGFIGAVGLQFQGEFSQPVRLNTLILRRAVPDWTELLSQLWQEWTTLKGWKESSINFVLAGPRDALLPPLLAAAAWIGASVLLYTVLALVLRRRYRSGSVATALTVFFLVGWALLDARWQWQLWQQLQVSYQQFAGKTPAQKRLAEIDGALFKFAQTIKQALPQQPSPTGSARVFIVNGDTSSEAVFNRLRARYHLLPYNVYSALDGLPPADAVTVGDYVLILKPYIGIQYDNQARQLAWDQTRLAVEPIVADDIGVLFRVGSG